MKWEAIPSLFCFFFNLVCQQNAVLEEVEIIIEQDIDFSESCSAKMQNKGDEDDF